MGHDLNRHCVACVDACGNLGVDLEQSCIPWSQPREGNVGLHTIDQHIDERCGWDCDISRRRLPGGQVDIHGAQTGSVDGNEIARLGGLAGYSVGVWHSHRGSVGQQDGALTVPRSIQSEDARRRILHFSGQRRRSAGVAFHRQSQQIPRCELGALDVDLCFRSIEDRDISVIGLHAHSIHLRGNGAGGGGLGRIPGKSLTHECSHRAWAAAAIIHITRAIGERQNNRRIRAYVHKHILGTGCARGIGGRELHGVAANLRSLGSPDKRAAAGVECGSWR